MAFGKPGAVHIATQKRIEEMFGNLPPGALEQIQKRDGN
jgi:hypothetical protein